MEINIKDEVALGAEKVLNKNGLNISMAFEIFLNKVICEQSVSWIFGNKINKDEQIINKVENKMTKRMAIRLFVNKGFKIYDEVTFASKNKTAYNYWANPHCSCLEHDWSLILNDCDNKKLYLFNIPAMAISKNEVIKRADNKQKIDLQIMYKDPTFTDNRSGIGFKKYFVDSIIYD